MKTINIMTSCDGNLMKFIPIQLESIAANLSDRKINFYLFHDGQNTSYVKKLRKIKYNNIKFHEIIVEDPQIYDEIAMRGGYGVVRPITAFAHINICRLIWIGFCILIRAMY